MHTLSCSPSAIKLYKKKKKKKCKQKLAVKMEAEQSETSPNDETNQEYRVQVTSKRKVTEMINRFNEVLNSVLDGQPDISEETKRNLLQDLLDVSPSAIRPSLAHF